MAASPARTGREVASLYGYLGRTTNNVAEGAQALVHALRFALARGASSVDVYSDSELLVRQIDGRYRVEAPACSRSTARRRASSSGSIGQASSTSRAREPRGRRARQPGGGREDLPGTSRRRVPSRGGSGAWRSAVRHGGVPQRTETGVSQIRSFAPRMSGADPRS